MHLHAEELINVHWTKEIEAEWTRNVVAKQDADAEGIQACLRGMRDAVDGWEVTGYAKHVPKFEAVDPKDQHVAAAAYKLSQEVEGAYPGQRALCGRSNDPQVRRFGARSRKGVGR